MADNSSDILSTSPSNTTYNSETEDDDTEYYDPPESFAHTSPAGSRTSTPNSLEPNRSLLPVHTVSAGSNQIGVLVHNMQKELQQVKSLMEVNNSRLLGMEAAFAPHTSTPLPRYTPSSAVPLPPYNEGMAPYLQRLDILAKRLEEEIQRSKDKEQEYKRRLEEMDRKLESFQKRIIPRGWTGFGVVVFLLVWPFVATKLWKCAKVWTPLLQSAIRNLLHR